MTWLDRLKSWRSRPAGDEFIVIDRRSGILKIGTHLLSPSTTPRDLPSLFALTPESPMKVLRDVVQIRFATARISDHNDAVEVTLRFEQAALVGCFFNIDPGAADPFRAHAEWLNRKLGVVDGAYTRFSWGIAGVVTDKSGDVHIFVHNRNWRWSG